MDDAQPTDSTDAAVRVRWRHRKRVRFLLVLVISLVVAIAALWLRRDNVADNVVADLLADNGIEATYSIASIGADRQVFENIVVGDAARPDLTIGQAVVTLRYRFGTPVIDSVRVLNARLYGRWNEQAGRISFGSLDRVLFEGEGQGGLPDLDVAITDGRARIETPWGNAGLWLEGRGVLANGFRGQVAAVLPTAGGAECGAGRTTLYGGIATTGDALKFDGPMRTLDVRCAGVRLGEADATLRASVSQRFDSFDVRSALSARRFASDFASSDGIEGTVQAGLRDGRVRALYDLRLESLVTPYLLARTTELDGEVRADSAFDTVRLDGQVAASGLAAAPDLERQARRFASDDSANPLAPLLRKFVTNAQSQLRGGRLDAGYEFARNGARTSLSVPSLRLANRAGRDIASVTRGAVLLDGGEITRVSGNVAMRGEGLPSLNGRMEQIDGRRTFVLAMQPYRAGEAELALPRLRVSESNGGAQFEGLAIVSGPLPGGAVRDLAFPVDGTISGGNVALWRRCTPFRFEQVRYRALTIDRDRITLCPASGSRLVSITERGTSIDAVTRNAELRGRIGSSPMRLRADSAQLTGSNQVSASGIALTIGADTAPNIFALDRLDGTLSSAIAGRFEGLDARLHAVPLDVSEGEGAWSVIDGALVLNDTTYTLNDRQELARFEPLIGRETELRLSGNMIDATSSLFEPASSQRVVDVTIRHDLSDGTGYADLSVPGIRFGRAVQPDTLTRLAFGVVANVEGTVTGNGRIDWNAAGVTSTGAFTTEDLDFAAPFGPVKGASGTIRFADLLGLRTEPNQNLQVASINPGIEVDNGTVAFDLESSQVLRVREGTWPFMGGTLTMQPVTLNIGTSETRRYRFVIEGLEAAQFVERMELGNFSATGTFDGAIEIVFDEMGNGTVENGLLTSRPPGGNVSYIGELTYKDLSPIANFAFRSLRSLDYERMEVRISGALAGELVTTVRFDGVGQGEGADSNFITRRIAALPLRFVVNIRAPFFQLITSLRSLYDPAFVRDPRDLGLVDDDGVRLRQSINQDEVPDDDPVDVIPPEGNRP